MLLPQETWVAAACGIPKCFEDDKMTSIFPSGTHKLFDSLLVCCLQ